MFLKFYFIYNIIVTAASKFCIVQEEINYKLVHCDSKHTRCCDEGCCLKESQEDDSLESIYIPKVGNNFVGPTNFPVHVWLVPLIGVIVLILFYVCVVLNKRDDDDESARRRLNTPPQTPEINLHLSFNNAGESTNFNNMHLPVIPLTPRTPPPGYATLTPPPAYSAAIHFPPLNPFKLGDKEEETKC